MNSLIDVLTSDAGRYALTAGAAGVAVIGAGLALRLLVRAVFATIGKAVTSAVNVATLLLPGKSHAGAGYSLAALMGTTGAGLVGYASSGTLGSLTGIGAVLLANSLVWTVRTGFKHDRW